MSDRRTVHASLTLRLVHAKATTSVGMQGAKIRLKTKRNLASDDPDWWPADHGDPRGPDARPKTILNSQRPIRPRVGVAQATRDGPASPLVAYGNTDAPAGVVVRHGNPLAPGGREPTELATQKTADEKSSAVFFYALLISSYRAADSITKCTSMWKRPCSSQRKPGPQRLSSRRLPWSIADKHFAA